MIPKLRDLLKQLLKESLSSKEESELNNILDEFVNSNYVAIDGNDIQEADFEQIISEFKENNKEESEYLEYIKPKLIEYLIDNKEEKLRGHHYYWTPSIKNNKILITFIPLSFDGIKDEKYSNPENIKIDYFPLKIDKYEFYGYWSYNNKVKLGKGDNIVEFQIVKIPSESKTQSHSLATLRHYKTKKISEDVLKWRNILVSYLRENNIPFLMNSDKGRSYIQVPKTYINIRS